MSVTFNGFEDLETFFVNNDLTNSLVGATVGGNASLPGSANGSSISFDALSPGPITFNGSTGVGEPGDGFYVGNFSQSYTFEVQSIPEPGSMALLSLGGILFMGRRKRA